MWVFFLILGLFLLSTLAVLLWNARKLRPVQTAPHAPAQADVDDEKALRRFGEVLRAPTVWPKQGEIDYAVFRDFLPLLQSLYPQLFAALEVHTVNTYGILLRWKGSDTTAAPVVLMSHYDVVAADENKWTHPPFCGAVIGSSIWGRGTVDTKCILSALLEAGEYLHQKGYVPQRDIWFSFTNNEETGGDTTPAIVRYLADQGVEPWFVLDEGGAIVESPAFGVKQEFAMVGVSEKGVADTVVEVTGVPGHSATPKASDAPARLVDAVERIRASAFKPVLSDTTQAMLRAIAAYASFGLRIVFGNLRVFAPLVKFIMRKNAETNAMLCTTAALTQLEGSTQINILPNKARAAFSVRIAPWDAVDGVLAQIREAAGEFAEVHAAYSFPPSPVSPTDCNAFRLLSRTVDDVYPGIPTVPYVMNGGTDSKHFTRICENVYRFAGFRFTSEERASMHGNDETLKVSSYQDGIRFYIRLLENLNT